jgi:diacylglycerol O-acyltransferase
MSTEPMAAADTAWLHMDRPNNLMVVNIVVVTEQPMDARELAAVLTERLLTPFRRFRQRVADPALTLGPLSTPSWVDDASFDLSRHLSVTPLPAPGDEPALRQVIGELASTALRRDRPLWELHLLTGYGKGSALLLRTHHAIADGAALMQVLLAITDPVEGHSHDGVLGWHDDDGGAALPGAVGRAAQRVTRAASQAGSAAASLSSAALAALANPRAALDLAGLARSEAAMLVKLGFGLQPEPNRLQGPLAPDKAYAWTRPVPLAALKANGRTTGSTINDLMLAVVTGALRLYFAEHGDEVDEAVVVVPVNLRTAGAAVPTGLGNEFGLVFVPLPTGEGDPHRRLAAIREQMGQIKTTREGAFIFSMLELMGQVPTGVQNAWLDAFSGKATAIVTNVAGPQHAVTLANCRITAAMAWVPVTGPVGLGLSIFSYDGQVSLGVVTDSQLVPDSDRLLALVQAELDRAVS